MGNEFDPIYAGDVMSELARQPAGEHAPVTAYRHEPYSQTHNVMGALIVIEIVMVLACLGTFVWLLLN
jgi:hypothetical protein